MLNPFDEMFGAIAETNGDGGVSLVVTAALITAFNALTVMLALMLWNGVLQKFGELSRTLREFSPCSKWFFLASVFGGPIAILGSFMAMGGFIGGAFAAVAALLYPVIVHTCLLLVRRENYEKGCSRDYCHNYRWNYDLRRRPDYRTWDR